MEESISLKTVDELAHLARLEFEPAEREEILQGMNRMLGFVNKLNELDTDGIEPLIYMTDEVNVLRADEPGGMIAQDEALKNAPRHDSDYFKAPKVISQNR